jgi:hypothetical protein
MSNEDNSTENSTNGEREERDPCANMNNDYKIDILAMFKEEEILHFLLKSLQRF